MAKTAPDLVTKLRAVAVTAENIAGTALMATLHAQAFSRHGEKPWTAQAFTQLLSSPGFIGHIYYSGHNPVGLSLVRMVCDEAELITIGIDPAFQKKGYAKAALKHLLTFLSAQKITSLFLEVREDNQRAISLYKRYGFNKKGERRGYYQTTDGTKYDAYLFSLNF